jgi:tricorn protease
VLGIVARPFRPMRLLPILPLLAAILPFAAASQEPAAPINARLMQMPAVSKDRIAFVFAGDIWLAPKEGGQAMRLSSPRGSEQFPRFSPDGTRIAFSGNYEGNTDIYVMPVTGGEPLRVTYHGSPDRLLGWWPDGKSLLVQSEREAFTGRVGQFFKVPVAGGLPERLAVPYGEFGAISPDGKSLAYTPITTDFATWKRYRGGMASDIWLFDLEKLTADKVAPSPAKESQPMWNGPRIYFLSDRDGQSRDNLWVYDTSTRTLRQLTKFTDFDVKFPSIGPDSLVFENGGKLWLLDLATDQTRAVDISVVTDEATRRPRAENVSTLIRNGAISPTGKRALFEARGDIYSVPVEHGIIRNLTESSGVAERYPAWSPDGKNVAYFSDRSGEYELTLRPADYKGEEQTITKLGPGYRYQPYWSPDSKKIAFIDSAMRIHLVQVAAKTEEVIDKQLWSYQGALENFRVSWTADSRWVTYPGDLENRQSAIIIYDTQERRRHQVTSGFFDDKLPTFDPDGKYLYYRSQRWFDPTYSSMDNTWIYMNGEAIVCVPLRKDVSSPLAPRNDEEPAPKPDEKKPDEKKDDKPADAKKADAVVESIAGTWNGTATGPKGDSGFSMKLTLDGNALSGAASIKDGPSLTVSGTWEAGAKTFTLTAKFPDGPTVTITGKIEGNSMTASGNLPTGAITIKATREADAALADKKPEAKPKSVQIDLADFEARAVVLPPSGGRFDNLIALPGKLLFQRRPRSGSTGGTSPVAIYDIEKREEKAVLDDVGGYELSADGKKLLAAKGGTWAIVAADVGQNLNKPLATAQLETTVNPGQEWRQLFTDAWRIERDFFYDPGLHGVDWPKMRERYGRLIEECSTRGDVNYVIGELLGELNASHTYRSGGAVEGGTSRNVGYLGCDYALDQGAYRIKRIPEVAQWEYTVRSPLRAPGVKVGEGDWLLAVNGRPLDVKKEPSAAFQGLADKPVILTVNDKPTLTGAREVLVQTMASEQWLRQYAWIEANRKKVEQLSGGQLGYIYVADTGQEGQNQLYRMWRAQYTKPGLLIDERWNSGGQIPDRFVEVLARKVVNYYGVRDGKDWQTPFIAHHGPQAMLANSWSGSGGDCFPFLFRENKLGPVIGTRTWGGLIGMTGAPPLLDGGSVTVPTFAIYDTSGKWIIEGYGVDPDIEVLDDPAELARGRDPQLERGIEELMKALKASPPQRPTKPAYPKRAP